MGRVKGWQLIVALSSIAIIGVLIAIRLTDSGSTSSIGMMSYLPEREAAYLFADVRAIRASGLLSKVVSNSVSEEPEYKSFVAQTGFDYTKDLDRIAASTGGGISYFLLEGRFDWRKLRDHVKSQGGTCNGEDCSVKGSTPERIISFRKVRSDLMALASGPSDTAAKAVERRAERKFGFDAPAKPVWLALPASALRGQELPAGTKLFAKALSAADMVLLSLGASGNDFELAMDAVCPREEDAVVLKHQLEGLTKLLQSFLAREQQKARNNDLSGVLTGGTFDRAGQHVKARWVLPKPFLESLGGS